MPASKRRRTEDGFVIDHQAIDKFCNHIHRNYPWAEKFLDKSARNISTTNLLQLVEELEGNVADFVRRVRGYTKLANIKRAVRLMHHLILRVKMAGSYLDFGNDKRFESLLTLLVCHFVHVNLVRVMTPEKQLQEARAIYRFAHITLQNPEAVLNAFLCSDLGFVLGTRNQLLQEILLCHILDNYEEYTKTEDCKVKYMAILKCYQTLFYNTNTCKSKVKEVKEELRKLAMTPRSVHNGEDMWVPVDVDYVIKNISTVGVFDIVRKELKSFFEEGHKIKPSYSSFAGLKRKTRHDNQNGNCLQNEPDELAERLMDPLPLFGGTKYFTPNFASAQPLVVDDQNPDERIMELGHAEDENVHAMEMEMYESEDTQEEVQPQPQPPKPDVEAGDDSDSDLEIIEIISAKDNVDDSEDEDDDFVPGERDEAEVSDDERALILYGLDDDEYSDYYD